VTFQLCENIMHALLDGDINTMFYIDEVGSLNNLYMFIEYITFLFVHSFILVLVYINCIFCLFVMFYGIVTELL
jgi:hypothetical protein